MAAKVGRMAGPHTRTQEREAGAATGANWAEQQAGRLAQRQPPAALQGP